MVEVDHITFWAVHCQMDSNARATDLAVTICFWVSSKLCFFHCRFDLKDRIFLALTQLHYLFRRCIQLDSIHIFVHCWCLEGFSLLVYRSFAQISESPILSSTLQAGWVLPF